MLQSTCPNESKLRALVDGGLGEFELASVEEHVLACESCFVRLKQWSGSEDVPWSELPDEVCDSATGELMQRLEAMRPADGTLPPDETPGHIAGHAPFAPPEWLGRFRIGELLGAGGVGLVYSAEDTALGRMVAIKLLRPEHAKNPVARRRFLDEARAVAAVSEDHIVPIHHVGEDRDLPYLVMPRLEGRTLAVALADGQTLQVPEAIEIARQVLEGLNAANQRGIIHRDIKPANLWLETNGRVRILDFGLARFLASDTRLTQTGLIIGTPAYMAPEQADGQDVDHRCDLFSLGAVMYQMLSGNVPFPGATALAVFKAMAAGDPTPLVVIDPMIPQRLSDLVAQLLRRDPEQRPGSATDVLRELQLVHEPIRRPWWHRRRVLQAVGAAAAGATGLGSWWWASRPGFHRELFLPPGSSAWIHHRLIELENTCTIECWCTALDPFVRKNATSLCGTDSFRIFGGEGTNGTNVFELSVCLKKPPANSPTVEKVHFGGGGVAVGQRIHLAGVHNKHDFRLFIDGKLIGMKDLRPYLSIVECDSFFLGATNAPQGLRFDDVRISSIVRYTKNFEPAERHIPDEHTTALYRCDESGGVMLLDSSGNGRHGMIHGPGEWVRTPRAVARRGSESTK